MSRLAVAQQFIRDNELKLAQQALDTVIDPETVALRSYLHRYFDEYDKEQNLIQSAQEFGIKSAYLTERAKWHMLDMFNKCEPRQALLLPKNPNKTPLPSTKEQMCFVTAGDHNFMTHMVECLESIKALPSYQNISIQIVDCGLTDEDRQYLTDNFCIDQIKDPGWDYPVKDILQVNRENPAKPFKDMVKNHHKSLTCRPFLKKHFPGYRYYCYVDADAWIQDEGCIDEMLVNCEAQGIGVSQHQVCRICKEHPWHSSGILNEVQKSFIADKARIIASFFCLDVQSGIDDEWAKDFGDAIKEQGYWYNTDEQTLNYRIHKRSVTKILGTRQHYGLCIGIPVIYGKDNVLYDPRDGEVMGSLHLGGRTKDFFLYPTQEFPYCSNQQMVQQHCANFVDWKLFQFCQQHQCLPHHLQLLSTQKIISCHYRVLPWRDKAEVLQKIQGGLSTCHG